MAANRQSVFGSFCSQKKQSLALASRKFSILALAFLLLVPFAAHADTPAAAAPITALDNALNATMKASATQSFAMRYAALAPVVDKTFDLVTVLHTVIGLRWSMLPADQQATLLTAFRANTIATYVSQFSSDDGTHFVMLPDQRMVGTDVVVETQIVPTSGDPTRLDYLMRQEADGWHAVDVLLTGTISQAAVQRSDFRSLLGPNDATRLIASLKEKTTQLSGGAIVE